MIKMAVDNSGTYSCEENKVKLESPYVLISICISVSVCTCVSVSDLRNFWTCSCRKSQKVSKIAKQFIEGHMTIFKEFVA